MNKISIIILGVALAILDATSIYAAPVTACYRWSTFTNERTVVSVEDGQLLVTAGQTASPLSGKEVGVCGFNTMAASVGSVVISTSGSQTGSHMFVNAGSVRLNGCRPIDMDCTSSQTSRTPTSWTCVVRNQQETIFDVFTLTRVTNPAADPRCNVFQDGTFLSDGDGLEQDSDYGPGNFKKSDHRK